MEKFVSWNPVIAALPVAAAFFVFGYVLQTALINPFITRPEHSQFMLLVAVAIVMVNALLMVFGPDARNVQVDYQLDSFEIGKILVDKARLYAAAAAVLTAGGCFFSSNIQKQERQFAPAPTTTSAPRLSG